MKQFIPLVLVILSSGCATLFGNNNREIRIVTIPPGAKVYMGGVEYGRTPMSLVLPSVDYTGQTITLVKSGYKNESIVIQTEFQNVGYWNLIVFPSFLIDMGTGYMFRIKPGSYEFSVPLESMASTNRVPESQIHIISNESQQVLMESK